MRPKRKSPLSGGLEIQAQKNPARGRASVFGAIKPQYGHNVVSLC